MADDYRYVQSYTITLPQTVIALSAQDVINLVVVPFSGSHRETNQRCVSSTDEALIDCSNGIQKIFKFSNVDNASPELVTAQDDLEAILRLSVPGLVSESRRPLGTSGNDNNSHHDGSATGHKLLVEPSVFNMGYLLPPSLAFLQRLRDIVPNG